MSMLMMGNIITYTQEIWKYFDIKNMKEFTMLYNTIDVLLLTDIMENFRETSLKIYKLPRSSIVLHNS